MAPIRARAARKGRKMNGGRMSTSSPLVFDPAGTRMGVGLWLGDGEGEGEGEGDSDGVGDAAGVGVGGPCSSNCAQGFGGTLAQMWCSPGGSPANGFTFTPEKLPALPAVVDPITLLGVSQ